MKLNCIAVDDEPLALELVKGFIEQTPFLEFKGQYDSALEALQAIQNQDIDLVFLDIQMSDLTGLELAKVLDGKQNKPLIVFATAFDQFAIEGYKVDAVDYLLKPFNYQEFLRAAMKAQSLKKLVSGEVSSPQSAPPLSESGEDYIFLKVEYQLVRVLHRDIIYIEGLKDYVKVHLVNKNHPILSLTSLKLLEERLPSSKFLRIHRSYIVSIDRIKAISKTSIEIGDVTLTISENYRKTFHQKLGTGF